MAPPANEQRPLITERAKQRAGARGGINLTREPAAFEAPGRPAARHRLFRGVARQLILWGTTNSPISKC